MLNPNFGKKTPQSARSRQKDTKNTSSSTSNASSNVRSRVRDEPKEETKPAVKKDYDAEREKMKRDREEFNKKKGIGGNNSAKAPEQTLKPAKWGKSRQKSRESPTQPEKVEENISPQKAM